MFNLFRRRGLAVLLLILVVLPISLILFRSPYTKSLLNIGPSKDSVDQYSVQSDVAGYKLALADTSYLDYVTGGLNLFNPNRIVDPQIYYSSTETQKQKYSVSKVKFILVNYIDRPISTIVEGNGRDTPPVIISMGDYFVQGNTLVVRVVVQFNELEKTPLTRKFSWENAFLRAAVNAMYYALGDKDPQSNQEKLVKMKFDIDQYVYTGIFSWPFRIMKE